MIYILLITYQLKHLVCDFLLQGRYMLGKFASGPEYILPLLAHVAVHGVATGLIVLAVKPQLTLALAGFDMGVHFVMDRIKASPHLLGRYKPLTALQYTTAVAEADKVKLRGNTFFWWSLGLDQMVHALTHYTIIWALMQ